MDKLKANGKTDIEKYTLINWVLENPPKKFTRVCPTTIPSHLKGWLQVLSASLSESLLSNWKLARQQKQVFGASKFENLPLYSSWLNFPTDTLASNNVAITCRNTATNSKPV